MKDNFNPCLEIVFEIEGYDKLTDDPDDRGGLTKFGISQNAHPDVDVASLTKERATELYRVKYWNKVRAEDLPWPIDLLVFDMAVNHGDGRAGRFLQNSVNSIMPLINPDMAPQRLKVDGVIGDKTVGAVAYLCRTNPLGAPLLTRELLLRRTRFYTLLVRTVSQRKYIYGWLRQRVVNLAARIGVFSPEEAI